MTAAVVELWPANPPKIQQPAGGGVFTRMLIERAPDAGGAPGAFGQIADIPIDTSDEATYYADLAGDDTAWYRSKYGNTALTIFSNPGPSTQAGQNVVTQDAQAEFADVSLTAAMWDRWGRQVLADLYVLGIWKEDEAELVITSTANGPTERYAVPGHIRDVFRIELRDTDGNALDSLTDPEEVAFSATNRNVRIFGAALPTTNYRYWVVGKAQYRTMGELTDDFHNLALHMLYVRVLQFRLKQRSNYKRFITFDPVTDIDTRDLKVMINDEKEEVALRAAALANPEPAIAIPN